MASKKRKPLRGHSRYGNTVPIYGTRDILALMILIGRDHLVGHTQQFPAARTALAMWQAVAQKSSWKNQADTQATFPGVKFLTPKLARFYPAGINCVITTQIAFNTGILIVLAVTKLEAQQTQES